MSKVAGSDRFCYLPSCAVTLNAPVFESHSGFGLSRGTGGRTSMETFRMKECGESLSVKVSSRSTRSGSAVP